MKIDILTLFPEMFVSLKSSILLRAQKNEKVEINIINIRDFSKDKNKKCDDYPFGGGAGMVMMAEPIYDAIMSVKAKDSYVIFTSAKGNVLNQKKVVSLSKLNHLIIVCGHYEGIDERVIGLCANEEISIGDYVLTGGEIPAMAITDAVCRYIDGVLNKDSLNEESFASGLLEYPQYTRPNEFMGRKVPDVLISGNHENIAKWRKQKSVEITKQRRPDLLGENYEN